MQTIFGGTLLGQAVSVAAELGVADQLAGGPKTAEEIAPVVSAHAPSLYRLLRALTLVEVLAEDDAHRFSLTPVGELLRSDAPGSMRAIATMSGQKWRLDALAELAHSVRTGEPAFRHAHGEGVFEWFAAHPDAGKLFDDAMTSVSSGSADVIARAYDFAATPRVVDVGGGQGLLIASILRAHPTTHGVLFDQPQVVGAAGPILKAAGVEGRCEIDAGSFFERVTTACDAYVMKHILHDWDDARCTLILGNCVAAMKPRARVLVIESIVSPPGVPSPAKILDLQMMAMTEGGMERTEAEYAALFAKAGLELLRIIPAGPRDSIIEATRR